MNKTGSIYIIKNLINQKVYIGQTSIKNPIKRWEQHYNDSQNEDDNLYIHKAMRKSGIENFCFQILETNININELDNREQFYISKYNSSNKNYGYNLTIGGNTSSKTKLKESDVEEIIRMIKNGESFENISIKYNVDRSTISDINCGETWYYSDIKYPIRKSINIKKNFSKEEIADIIEMLKRNNSLSQIAKKYDVSITTISKINTGEIYRDDLINYPINENKCYTQLSIEKIKQIIYYLENTDMLQREIANCTNTSRKSVNNINNGKHHIDELKQLGYSKFPIRNSEKP